MNDCSRLLVLAALAVPTVLSACGDSSESVATTTLPPPTPEEQCWGKLSDVVFDYFNTRDAGPLIDIAGSENGVLIYFTYAIGNAVQVRYASGDDAAAESLHASVT